MIRKLIVLFLICAPLASASSVKFADWKYEVTFLKKGCIYPVSEFSYQLQSPMEVKVNDLYIKVPKGFVTDLATIPRAFWSFDSPFDGKYMSSAILHDYIYSCSIVHNRQEADRILYSGMISEGSSKWTANKFYMAVRLFGGGHYDRQKKCR